MVEELKKYFKAIVEKSAIVEEWLEFSEYLKQLNKENGGENEFEEDEIMFRVNVSLDTQRSTRRHLFFCMVGNIKNNFLNAHEAYTTLPKDISMFKRYEWRAARVLNKAEKAKDILGKAQDVFEDLGQDLMETKFFDIDVKGRLHFIDKTKTIGEISA